MKFPQLNKKEKKLKKNLLKNNPFFLQFNILEASVQKSGCFLILDYLIMRKFLIAGLGNIGAEYENTRHNIGFKILDHLAAQENLSFKTERLADRAELRFKGRTFILIKPSTMMNLSGRAIRYWLDKEKIPLENLLVIIDDLNIPFGEIRIKTRGSDGGHNGLKDIQQTLNTNKYSRFRFGIGDEFSKGNQVNYVLGEWTPEQQKALPERLEKSAEAIKAFGTIGAERTMNFFNGQ